MIREKTALEEYEEIGFWNMECVKISERKAEKNLIRKLKRRVENNGSKNRVRKS